MNDFKQSVSNALRYWETRRVFYNAVLMAVAAGWVILTWPHFRSVQLMGIPPGDTHPALMILIILAFLANVCYSTAYLVDIPLQLTFARWRKYRWALLLAGTLFATLVENEFIKAGRHSDGVAQREEGIWVLEATGMPSVLIETGFLTNEEEEKYLNSKDGQNEIVGNIVDALRLYQDSQ